MADRLQLGDTGAKLPKGSIIVVGANGEIYGLPPGTNGQQLQFDDSESLGVKWAAAS